MSAYLKIPLAEKHAELIEAAIALRIPPENILPLSERDLYYLVKPITDEQQQAFLDQHKNLRIKAMTNEGWALLKEEIEKQGLSFEDWFAENSYKEDIDFKMLVSEEFHEKITAFNSDLSLQTDALAREIFGDSIRTAQEVFDAYNFAVRSGLTFLGIKFSEKLPEAAEAPAEAESVTE